MRISILFAGLLIAFLASAQTPAPSSAPIPDSVLYRSLFQHVMIVKATFDHDGAVGADITKEVKTELSRMGLTAAGYSSLVSIAADFLAAHKAYLAQRTQLLKAQQDAVAANAPLPSNGQLTALAAQDAAMAQDHINKLHSALGDSQFAALDAFARSVILPKVGGKPLKRQ